MGKYIIEIGDAYAEYICGKGDMLCLPVRINEFEDNWLNTNIPLTPYTEPDIEKAREEAYAQGYSKGFTNAKVQCNIQAEKDLREVGERHYQKGLSDAWEAATKIANMPYGEEEKVFGSGGWKFIINHTASEAIEKIRQYEQEQEQEEEQIQVGDEVRNIENGWIAVVSNIDGECMILMDANGVLGDDYHVNRFTKTGRHFPEIAAVLEKMRGEQDG